MDTKDVMCLATRIDGLPQGGVPCVASPAMFNDKPALSCLYCGKFLEGVPAGYSNTDVKRLPVFKMSSEYTRCLKPMKLTMNWPPTLIGCGGRGEVAPSHPRKGAQLTDDPNDGFVCELCHGTGFLRVKDIYGKPK